MGKERDAQKHRNRLKPADVVVALIAGRGRHEIPLIATMPDEIADASWSNMASIGL